MNQLAKRTPNAITLNEASYLQALERPLTCLPAELRPSAFDVWITHRFLKDFETSLPLTATLSIWMDRFGLRPDDADAICKKLIHPIRVAKHKWLNDLMTDLAEMVAEVLEKRAKEPKPGQLQLATSEPEYASPDEISEFVAEAKRKLADSMSMPADPKKPR